MEYIVKRADGGPDLYLCVVERGELVWRRGKDRATRFVTKSSAAQAMATYAHEFEPDRYDVTILPDEPALNEQVPVVFTRRELGFLRDVIGDTTGGRIPGGGADVGFSIYDKVDELSKGVPVCWRWAGATTREVEYIREGE